MTLIRCMKYRVMAYIGGWRAILQTPEPGEGNLHLSGRTAWLLWRSAYLAKSKLSWYPTDWSPVS